MSAPNTITHDAAARLVKLPPADLAKLVDQGAVPRVARDAYSLIPLVHGYIDHLRAEQQRIIQRPTQSEIAEHLDISDRRVRELAAEWAIDSKQITLAEWRLRYLRKLREEAAGRAAVGDLDLATERARLAKEQADKFAMQNAVTRGELAPVILLEEILTKTASKIAGIFDAIPGNIHRRFPEIPTDAINQIAGEIIKIRNTVAAMSFDDLDDEESPEKTSDTAPVDA